MPESLSQSPSVSPSISPSLSPSRSPSLSPSISPSISPSLSPSVSPSSSPSLSPSKSPSVSPSLSPSMSPSPSPSESPSPSPSPGTGEFDEPIMVMTGESDSNPESSGTFVFPTMGMFDIAPLESYGTLVSPHEEYEGYGETTTTTFRGVVMNLLNQAMSTYSNYPFNSLAYFNEKYYGATGSGIYELSGDFDNNIPINAHIKTGPMDFGSKQVKYIRDVWVTHRTDGHLALVFWVDEDNTVEVERDTVKVNRNELTEEKVKVPRGLKGRYYTIELKNLSGAYFDIDKLEVMVDVTGRKR